MQAWEMKEPAQGRGLWPLRRPPPRGALGPAVGPGTQHLLLSSLTGSLGCLPLRPLVATGGLWAGLDLGRARALARLGHLWWLRPGRWSETGPGCQRHDPVQKGRNCCFLLRRATPRLPTSS